MVSLKTLLIICLFLTTSCSDKSTQPITEKSPSPPPVNQAPDTDIPSNYQEIVESPAPSESDEPKQVDENHFDTYTAELMQQTQQELLSESLPQENKIRNVEFANRIFSVEFRYGKRSRLKIITHTEKVFNFEHTDNQGNIQYFDAFEKSSGLPFIAGKTNVAYSAQAKTIRSSQKHITIIKIKDLSTNAIVYVVYAKKFGKVNPRFVRGHDYSRELTKTSKIFLDRTRENPSVVGEFYAVLTEQNNISNASKFKLTISDNFTLESQPLVGHYRLDQPNVIPLSVDYNSFKHTFFWGSAAYIAIQDASYVIESSKNPIKLTALNVDLKIEAKETIQGQKNTLPIRFLIKFK